MDEGETRLQRVRRERESGERPVVSKGALRLSNVTGTLVVGGAMILVVICIVLWATGAADISGF